MNEEKKNNQADSAFTDLSSFETVKLQPFSQSGNILKKGSVVVGGAHEIELHDGDNVHPSVMVHKDGEKIERIEFLCTCGHTTTVKLEYDDD